MKKLVATSAASLRSMFLSNLRALRFLQIIPKKKKLRRKVLSNDCLSYLAEDALLDGFSER